MWIHKNNERISACCLGWIIVFAAAFTFYVYKWIQFDNKLKYFDNEITLGMHVSLVQRILGPPSAAVLESEMRFPDPGHTDYYYYYGGGWFLRKNMYLEFDGQTKLLVKKERIQFMGLGSGPEYMPAP